MDDPLAGSVRCISYPSHCRPVCVRAFSNGRSLDLAARFLSISNLHHSPVLVSVTTQSLGGQSLGCVGTPLDVIIAGADTICKTVNKLWRVTWKTTTHSYSNLL